MGSTMISGNQLKVEPLIGRFAQTFLNRYKNENHLLHAAYFASHEVPYYNNN